MEILVDCDGVLADFLSPTLEKLNKATGKSITLREYVSFGIFEMEQPYGISMDEFWEIIEKDDEHWNNLKPFPWAQDLLDFCETLGRVTICTSPSRNPMCAMQKTQWLMDHLNLPNDGLILGKRKELMARPDHVLLDDYPKNIAKFRANGGKAILIPSNWNTVNLFFDVVKNAIVEGMKEETVLQEAHRLVSVERQAHYGHPLDDFTRTALIWTAILSKKLRPGAVIEPTDVPLCMVGVKLSREVNHPKRDNRVDGVGYWQTLQMVIDEQDRRTSR